MFDYNNIVMMIASEYDKCIDVVNNCRNIANASMINASIYDIIDDITNKHIDAIINAMLILIKIDDGITICDVAEYIADDVTKRVGDKIEKQIFTHIQYEMKCRICVNIFDDVFNRIYHKLDKMVK